MSLQHIQKNSPRLLPKPAKFEKNPPNGYRVIRKTKCGAGSFPIHKQASLAGRLNIAGFRFVFPLIRMLLMFRTYLVVLQIGTTFRSDSRSQCLKHALTEVEKTWEEVEVHRAPDPYVEHPSVRMEKD